jgi:hypothetical protein
VAEIAQTCREEANEAFWLVRLAVAQFDLIGELVLTATALASLMHCACGVGLRVLAWMLSYTMVRLA